MRFLLSLIARYGLRNFEFRRAIPVAIVFVLLGAISVAAAQFMPASYNEAVIAEFAGAEPATDADITASHLCVVHSACTAGDVRIGVFTIAYQHSVSDRTLLDTEPGRGRATPPLDRPPISVATI